MQSSPVGQSDCAVHCGVASLGETQMPPEQEAMRASILTQSSSVVHVYRQ
jgi:hypothetical protein